MTHREGCPRAAVSSLPPDSPLPVVVPVHVPGRFTLMMRVGRMPLPGKVCIVIPGTALVLQVDQVLPAGSAYVTGAHNEGSSTVLDSGATEHISPKVKGPLSTAPISVIHD